MITEVKGNIFNFIEEGCILLHQVNCQGVMGGGIAKTVKELFPEVFTRYKNYCSKTNKDCLGDMLPVMSKYNKCNFYIGNCFGQKYYGRDKRYTDYEGLKRSLDLVTIFLGIDDSPCSKILIPKYIGCGLAGGDWNIVSEIIDEVFKDHEVLIVDFDGSKIAKIQK